jgi:hypothetical protein
MVEQPSPNRVAKISSTGRSDDVRDGELNFSNRPTHHSFGFTSNMFAFTYPSLRGLGAMGNRKSPVAGRATGREFGKNKMSAKSAPTKLSGGTL